MKFKATVTETKQPRVNNRVALEAFMSTFEAGDSLDIDICKEKKQRSLSQNNTIWLMAETLDKLFMHYGDKNRAKWVILIEIGHCDEYIIKGVPTLLPRKTSGLSTKEFSELLESIIRFGVMEYQYDLTP